MPTPHMMQDGFSHAIHCARGELGADRFMVVLGDHLYRSSARDRRSCVQQLVLIRIR